ncbi:hypothetical protein DOTSEDRAFT_72729 [Dothistroma septosporum NZE10]|uniref:UBA domain-containing protein n=1 Tax=Dothistroma septosporum (strain NZE10 / CBS 128990) TaxID=675120 RepID=M2YN94_DOTSN|nr:hypothetical protein DOTSEDRAFT_72729 [Dothistroma septosporum NZE10]
MRPMNQPPLPKRPESQKAATMAVEPLQSAVDEVVAFTGTDADSARSWLSATGNDASKAVNAILDNEDISKYQQERNWDDTMFDADREGNQHLRPLGSSANPTRGNSPAPSLSSMNPKTKTDEDRELEAALLASRQDAGIPYQQETGTIGVDGTENKKFGPATKADYETAQWAVVPYQQEVVPDIPLGDRRHQSGKPRFLKHLPDGDYTPNLLTICHAIPQARTCLLMNKYEQDDYGFDQEWWRGQPIATPKIVNTVDQVLAEPEDDRFKELVMEVQRLMAFLDSSNRAYASIGALTQAEIIKNNELSSKAGSLVELLLTSWRTAALRCVEDGVSYQEDTGSMKAAFERLFTSIVNTDDPQGMENEHMGLLDLKLNSDPDQDGLTHLFELLGGFLWNNDVNVNNYIETPADVLVMKIHQEKSGSTLGVDVPQGFYVDKYLKENIAATQELRKQMSEGKERISKIVQIEQKLNSWPHPTKVTKVDAGQMLKHTIGHFSGQNRKEIDEADQSNSAPIGHTMSEESLAVAAQLEQVMTSVQDKLEKLKVEKEKAQKLVADLSLSNPPGLAGTDLKHRYTLRGVATKPNVTYVLRPKAKDLTRATENGDTEMLLPKQADEQQYQWWRIEYPLNGSSAPSNEIFVPDDSVLHAVQVEHNSALLVYASDDACEEVDDDDLPEALQKFIARDNGAFKAELNKPPAYSDLNDIPRMSIERRGSNDSTMANRSENGDRDYEHNAEQHSSYALGYDVTKSSNAMEVDDLPVQEIRLPPADESGMEMEMVEKAHSPLVTAGVNGFGADTYGDTTMGEIGESQDYGVGGAPVGR